MVAMVTVINCFSSLSSLIAAYFASHDQRRSPNSVVYGDQTSRGVFQTGMYYENTLIEHTFK